LEFYFVGYAQVAKRNPESLTSCKKENEHSLRLAPQNAHLFFSWLLPLSCLSSGSFKRLRYFKRIYCQRRPVGKFEAFECYALTLLLPVQSGENQQTQTMKPLETTWYGYGTIKR